MSTRANSLSVVVGAVCGVGILPIPAPKFIHPLIRISIADGGNVLPQQRGQHFRPGAAGRKTMSSLWHDEANST